MRFWTVGINFWKFYPVKILSWKSDLDETSCRTAGCPKSCFLKIEFVVWLESILGHFVTNGGHTVPILSWKLNLDQTSCMGYLGIPSHVSEKN